MNHQVFERTWHSSEYACFSVITPSPRREPLAWSMGLMGRPRPDGAAALQPPTSPEACKHPDSLVSAPFLAPSRGVACASCRSRPPSGGTRAAAGRGTARCGRRARKRPFAGTPGRFNSPRVRSPPASFATASAKWRARVTRARRPGREGAALAAPLLPPQQPNSYSDLKSSKRTR